MTAIAPTAAEVKYVSGPKDSDQQAGEAFSAGAPVYFDIATGTWKKLLGNGTAPQAGQNGYGIALATADAAGARVSVARPGSIVDLGATAAALAGILYCASHTAGDYAPSADLVTSDKVTPVALGIGTHQVQVVGFGYNAGAVHT